MAIKGGILRLVLIIAYFIAFVCALLITGSFAWFVTESSTTRNSTTLGLSSFVLLYTLLQTLFTCCTAGIPYLWLLSIFFDTVSLIFMIAIAALNDSARHGCGDEAWDDWDRESWKFLREIWRDGGMHACRLFVASFAVAILAVFVFAGTILVQVLVRMRKRRDRRGVVKSGGAGDGDVLPVQHPMPGQVQTGYA